MPRVSVLIPSYNHGKYISQAIQSVLDQSYQDFELIIVDDGSSDNSVDVIKSFKDSRIRPFFFTENKGAAIATTQCIMESKGEYLAILNSDDLFLPSKLEKQVSYLDEHPEVGAVFSYLQLIDDTEKDFNDVNHPWYNLFKQPNRTRFEWLNYFFYNGNCLCHPSVLSRRACYDTIALPDQRLVQLGDFNRWIKICLKHEIYIIPENLVKFRVCRGNVNMSSDKPENKIKSAWTLGRILKLYLSIKDCDDFVKVFPEYLNKERGLEADLIPYYIAKLALEVNSPVYQYFALETLHDLLADEETARLLYDKHGFSNKDFLGLTGKYDIFKLATKWARIKDYSFFMKTIRQLVRKFPKLKSALQSIVKPGGNT